jgi:signal transduction histidine kinase
MQIDQTVFEQMPFPYFIINHDYRILFSSESSKQQFSFPSSFLELIHSSQSAVFQEFVQKPGKTAPFELKMLGKDGKIKTFQIYKSLLKNGQIHLCCIPLNSHLAEFDHLLELVEEKITSIQNQLQSNHTQFAETMKEIKDAAYLSDQLKTISQLAAGIVHEIRNPLTTVKGFIQLIQPYLTEIGKEDYARIALEEINRANDIIFEFLNASKPREKKKQLTNVNKLIDDIVKLYESEAILRNIEIETVLTSKDAILYIDAKQVKQVLVNLVKNAVEAIEENPEITKGYIRLKTETVEGNALILIEDNGIGISKETMEKLFIPFFSTKNSGTGIGLSVCKKIIEDHDGTIQVESTPFLGTAFQITLPIYQHSDKVER